MAVTRVGLLGHGAIGAVLARLLRNDQIPGCALGAILVRRPSAVSEQAPNIHELCDRSDIVVEAAGHAALTEFGPTILNAGPDLLVASAGALGDRSLHEKLVATGPGRLLVSTGAIGGLDTLRAAQLAGGLDAVRLHTTKPCTSVREGWMSAELIDHLEHTAEPITVFTGSAREAARLFSRSVNVAATLALATIGFDATAVTITADPDALLVEHVITARGDAGQYEFSFRNKPSSTNPRTSAITPYAIARALIDRTARCIVGV